jgi:hypothetical protein
VKKAKMTERDIKILKSFSKQLLFYSQYSSGFNAAPNALFKYIPTVINNWKLAGRKSYSEYINSLSMDATYLRDFKEKFMQHNSKLLPKVTPVEQNGDLILLSANNKKSLFRINTAVQIFKPYVQHQNRSYKFIQKYVTKSGEIQGIYKMLETLGFNKKNLRIYEYNTKKTAFDSNKVEIKNPLKLNPSDSMVMNYVPIETKKTTIKKAVKEKQKTVKEKQKTVKEKQKTVKEKREVTIKLPYSEQYAVTLQEWNSLNKEQQIMLEFQHKNC